jgi:flavin-dependent dehydrogenase
MLFANARNAGADAHEDTKVHQVSSNPDGTYEVIAKNSAGEVRKWRARFLVDASGRDTFLSSTRGWKSRNPRHASAAIFGHFRKVARRPGKDQGNISLYWFEHGWIWMIPLQDDIMSIGAVCRPAYLKSRSASLDEFLATTLNGVSQIQRRMTNAEPVVPAQATGNYSYTSNRMSIPGALLVGDAYAFIDPVFSSGVYLAMSSAERGVAVADAWLQGSRIRYALACRRYERETRRGLALFSWFIYRFTTPAMQSLMSDPRNTFRVMQAVISMLAGDVYENNLVRRRLYVFKAIYSILSLKDWRASLRARRARVANVDAAHRAIE